MLSVAVFAQVVPHAINPVLQVHMPAVHVALAGQAFPHAPQFDMSVAVLVHVAPHATRPVPEQTHAPPVQVAVDGHAFPHAPQLALSVSVLTHVAPHICIVPLQPVSTTGTSWTSVPIAS